MRSVLGVALLATASVACGGNVVFVDDQGDGGATAGTSIVATSSQSVGTSVGTGGGLPAIVPTVDAVKLGANCQPAVGPDPVTGAVVVRYDNLGAGPGSLTLTSADLIFSNPMEGWVFSIALDPTSTGSIGGGQTITVEHTKVASPGNSAFICQLCGQDGTVALHYVDDFGQPVDASAPLALGCTF